MTRQKLHEWIICLATTITLGAPVISFLLSGGVAINFFIGEVDHHLHHHRIPLTRSPIRRILEIMLRDYVLVH
ncbi:hypothetical protein E2C01_041653 [Portunus trituberculatus]|uniref:Uncharacterized protein n=1 Tax=Portunus trituberculatus TaxID=210409 RepID=A0A5B7FN51_PORTR|nr:hypothetical protein [Portunus trituberculatus]